MDVTVAGGPAYVLTKLTQRVFDIYADPWPCSSHQDMRHWTVPFGLFPDADESPWIVVAVSVDVYQDLLMVFTSRNEYVFFGFNRVGFIDVAS